MDSTNKRNPVFKLDLAYFDTVNKIMVKEKANIEQISNKLWRTGFDERLVIDNKSVDNIKMKIIINEKFLNSF